MSLVQHSSIIKNHRPALCNTIYFKTVGQHTYIPPEDLAFIVVEVQAGGGGGGGCPSTTSIHWACSGGGAGGGYAEKKILKDSLQASEIIIVGAGGIAGTAAGVGGAGGTSSFGTHASATGGAGGTAGIRSIDSHGQFCGGSIGGTSTNGDLVIPGERAPLYWHSFTNHLACPSGGASHLGSATAAMFGGRNYGGGGGGLYNVASAAAASGTPGAQGIVIINEYF